MYQTQAFKAVFKRASEWVTPRVKEKENDTEKGRDVVSSVEGERERERELWRSG